MQKRRTVRFESSDSDWVSTFRVELAKILIYQGESSDALDAACNNRFPITPASNLKLGERYFFPLRKLGLGILIMRNRRFWRRRFNAPMRVLCGSSRTR